MGKYKRPAKRRAEATRRAALFIEEQRPYPVRAKVGAITYSGMIHTDADQTLTFAYTTSKGEQRTARKFTVI